MNKLNYGALFMQLPEDEMPKLGVRKKIIRKKQTK